MMKDYVPVRLDEIAWGERTLSKLYREIPCIDSPGSYSNIQIIVNIKTNVISYELTRTVDGVTEKLTDSYDYLTEKGALKWLYRELSKLAFYKKLEYDIPYKLTSIISNWNSETRSYIDFIYETSSKQVLKDEALAFSKAYLSYEGPSYQKIKYQNGFLKENEIVNCLQTEAPHIARALLDYAFKEASDYESIVLDILNGDYDNELLQLHADSF